MSRFNGVLLLLVTEWSSVVVGSRCYVGQAGLDADCQCVRPGPA